MTCYFSKLGFSLPCQRDKMVGSSSSLLWEKKILDLEAFLTARNRVIQCQLARDYMVSWETGLAVVKPGDVPGRPGRLATRLRKATSKRQIVHSWALMLSQHPTGGCP